MHFLPAEADDDVADALREFTLSFRGRDSYLDEAAEATRRVKTETFAA